MRRLLLRLGYTVHTPAELYGARTAAEGAPDEDWLAKVGTRGWTVIGRDVKIYERPAELAAYRQARIHVFLLPGQAIVTELVHLIEVNLTDMCTFASSRQPGTWRLTKRGPVPYDIARAQKTAQRRTSR